MSVLDIFVQQYKFFELNMIQRAKNNVKWTKDQWSSEQTETFHQNLSGQKWGQKFQELDTDASASWSENIDQALSDVQTPQSRILTIEMMGRCLQVDCLDIEDVKSLLIRLDGFEQLRLKRNQIKMVILESLCKENKLLMPLLDKECKQYSQKKAKDLFL